MTDISKLGNKQEDLLRQLVDSNLTVSTDVHTNNSADLYIQK